MPIINFTSALKRFYPDLHPLSIEGETVADVLNKLDETYPGMIDYLIDEHGMLRHHINIFIGDKMIADRDNLLDDITSEEEILIFQALSGG